MKVDASRLTKDITDHPSASKRFFHNFLLIITVSVFFFDWGYPYPSRGPQVSLPEILVAFFILTCAFSKVAISPFRYTQASIKAFLLILGIFLAGSVGAILHLQHIKWFEHIASGMKLLFWGVFFSFIVDIGKRLKDDMLARKIWNYYLLSASVISAIAILQYGFFGITGAHLDLHPLQDQIWIVRGGYYRATGIYREPAWLGTVLIPALIAQGTIFFRRNHPADLIKSSLLLGGLLASFSLGSYIVVGIWGSAALGMWAFKRLGIFLRPTITKRELHSLMLISCSVFIGVVVLTLWAIPLIVPRIVEETQRVLPIITEGEIPVLSSGVMRFTTYLGFFSVLQQSPLFGIGFDQMGYVSELIGGYFDGTSSGILGFIGISSGLLGLSLLVYLFLFVWKGRGNRKALSRNERSDLIILGRAILIAIILEQLVLYSGILNAPFWIPLAIAYILIASGQIRPDAQKPSTAA